MNKRWRYVLAGVIALVSVFVLTVVIYPALAAENYDAELMVEESEEALEGSDSNTGNPMVAEEQEPSTDNTESIMEIEEQDTYADSTAIMAESEEQDASSDNTEIKAEVEEQKSSEGETDSLQTQEMEQEPADQIQQKSVRSAKQAQQKTEQSYNGIVYITPEQFGAKGDGVTDDTAAFEKCMKDSTKYVLLQGKYLLKRHLTTDVEKYFYAAPKKGYAGASIICNVTDDFMNLSFTNVTFENVEFYSTIVRGGTSPHGEKYTRTSSIVFVEIWSGNGTFNNCHFYNALTAIRGRKSSNSSVIPKNINVNRSTFTECKIPIQGYSVSTDVRNSSFINDGELYRRELGGNDNSTQYNGDLYSGDHCIYMETFGCKSVTVVNCKVDTLNSESGASFQIYGKQSNSNTVPSLTVESCDLNSNGVASASKANVVVKDTVFNEQKSENYIAWVEAGSLKLMNSEFNHTYAFSYASTNVKPEATDCTFRLLTSLSKTRCNFPAMSTNCTYINWGGNVRVNGTSFKGCVFTSESSTVLNKLYIDNKSGMKISLINSSFKKGSKITNNNAAVTEYSGCSTFQ